MRGCKHDREPCSHPFHSTSNIDGYSAGVDAGLDEPHSQRQRRRLVQRETVCTKRPVSGLSLPFQVWAGVQEPVVVEVDRAPIELE